MSIFDNDVYLNSKYVFLDKYVSIMYRGFWTPAKYEKLIHEVDAPQFHNTMNEVDKETVRRCILAIAMVEDKVKSFWSTLHMELPQTVISDVGALFGMTETTHRRSYHSLAVEIGVDIADIEKYDILRDRLSYLNKHLEKDPKVIGKKRTLKKTTLFTALVERGSLFTQFYILMSFAKHNKGLKTISALQQSTATEEIVHYNFGIDVINIIKEEHPQLWEEYLIDLIEKNLMMAYETELKLIDWFFEKGIPDHITKEEVVNFLNYNFNIIANDLDLQLKFTFDNALYTEKSEWMLLKLHSSEPDFFDMPGGGYASEDVEIDIDNFEF